MAATNVISTTPSFPVGSIFLTAAERLILVNY